MKKMFENLTKKTETIKIAEANSTEISRVLSSFYTINNSKYIFINVKNHTLKCMACLVLEHPKIWFAYSRVETGSLRKHKFCCNKFPSIKLIKSNQELIIQ